MTPIRSLFVSAIALSLLLTGSARAQDAAVGEPAPQFQLTDVLTGEVVSLSDYSDKTVILVWQSITCPWNVNREDGGYERVIYPLAEQWAEQDVVILAINSNQSESVEEVASYATEQQTPYPILKDPGNIIADAYGAQTTPHFFVISAGDEQTLVYQGGFESVPSSPEQCGQSDEPYLGPVVQALLAGEELPYTETLSKGCTIKRVK